MQRVTEYCETKEELQFAKDQIEKYDHGVSVFREKKGKFALYRTDRFENGREK